MEVVIYSTIATAPGQVTVVTSDNQTIDSLISSFCTEKGIRHQREYVLRNIKHEFLENTRKLRTCGVQNGDILYLGVQVRSQRCMSGCNQWWLLAAVALFIGAAGLVAVSVLKVNGSDQPNDYGVVIDAGSSHSQLYVYRWEADKYNNTAIAKQVHTCKGSGKGIGHYVENPQEAGASLQPCLDSAKKVVPDVDYKKTPLYLGATAGMRLLNASNPTASAAILDSVRITMSTYPFNFSEPKVQAKIISGKDEGSFGWITVNYISNNFVQHNLLAAMGIRTEKTSPQVVGALDMGGASTQITFVPENPDKLPAAYLSSLLLYGNTYNIYSHSYLCYGLNEAARQYEASLAKSQNNTQLLSDPCRPQGVNVTLTASDIFEVPCTKHTNNWGRFNLLPGSSYTFVGAGNVTQCHQQVQQLFNFSTSCPEPPCSFNGVHQPPVRGTYLAFSGYYYIMEYLNLTGRGDRDAFVTKYTEYCGKHWSQIEHDDNHRDLCLHAVYVDILLTDGYNFSDNWTNIIFQEKVEDTELGWSLGFMLNVSNSIPSEYPSYPISNVVFVILVLLFSVFIALAVGFALYAMSHRKEKPNTYERLASYGSV